MGLQSLKRKLFTRCAGCGGWSTKANPVNTRIGNRVSEPQRPWHSEVGLFHGTCASVASRANRRRAAQHSADPHWHLYRFAKHLHESLIEGRVDKNDVPGMLKRVADGSKYEYEKIIKQGEL